MVGCNDTGREIGPGYHQLIGILTIAVCARSPSTSSPETAAAEPADAVGAKWRPGTTTTCSRSSPAKLMREPCPGDDLHFRHARLLLELQKESPATHNVPDPPPIRYTAKAGRSDVRIQGDSACFSLRHLRVAELVRRARAEAGLVDVGDQALIRGLATAGPNMRPRHSLSYCGRR
jgi:hypothetical protein